MSATTIRNKLIDIIREADDKKLYAIYNLLENEIVQSNEWWKDELITSELERRYEDLESGADKGYTIEQMEQSFNNLRLNRYGK